MFFVQDQKEFLALPFRRHDMHRPDAAQLPAHQRDIGHGGKFQKHLRAGGQQFRKQFQDIRLTVLQAENLPAVPGTPGRVQEQDIRMKTAQQRGYLPSFHLGALHLHISGTQFLEIMRRSGRQFRFHLIIQHLGKHLGKRPGVHAESSGQIRYPEGSLF